MEDPGWTIDQLAAQVAAALGDGGADQPSRRVRSLPDRRAIRWYTTIGLLDRPQLRGRTGWYHRRHLLQLVAIKRLQASGRPLAEIQAELAGAAEATLRQIAQVPAEQLDATPEPVSRADSVRPRFWSAIPAVASQSAAADSGPGPLRDGPDGPDGPDDPDTFSGSTGARELAAGAGAYEQLGVRYAIDLGGGVTLLLDGGSDTPQPEDIAAVRRAAQPLLHQLTRRGLARVVPDEE
ncbi:MAG: MerR family transcriptional regulator [Micromonosporaceae bacterium]